MKKIQTLLIALSTIFILHSCKTDVDLYADYQETTIVYGLLDHTKDTNFIKITKSLGGGNALENAQIYDLSNYNDTLDVKLISNDDKKVITLDRISVYKPENPDDVFYSGRNQVVYYTAEKLSPGTTYNLQVTRNDGVVLKSEATTINDIDIISKKTINFTVESSAQIKWKDIDANDIYNGSHASYYEVFGFFHYKQVEEGTTDSVDYFMKWKMGSGLYENLVNDKKELIISYTPSSLFSQLAADDNINNLPDGCVRVAGKFDIVVSAIGEELNNYILINNSSSAIQDTPEYTNIENGLGLFSSRSQASKSVNLSPDSRVKLVNDYDWGFR